MRILKAKKLNYGHQYENGMLSRKGIRAMNQAVEVAMDSPECLIELDELEKMFKKRVYFIEKNNFMTKLRDFADILEPLLP